MIIVQNVTIFWTKATRGAPRSNERSVLPRAFQIDACANKSKKYEFSSFVMSESNGFTLTKREVTHSDVLPRIQGCLALFEEMDGCLSLGLRWVSSDGQPKRYPRPEAIKLHKGEWAQLSINGRHTNYSGQYYSEDTYNVAYGDEFQPDIFVSTVPNKEFSLKSDLF